MQLFSNYFYRQKQYRLLMDKAFDNALTVEELVLRVCKMMKKARLHPHFFQDNRLITSAQYLVFYGLNLPHDYANQHHLTMSVSQKALAALIPLLEKRLEHRLPIPYITHEAEYLGRMFYVNQDVLVPRSIMNTRFEDFINQVSWSNYRVLDLCTGSGCIGISLALINPNIKVDLADISEKALTVAQVNINKFDLSKRVRCIQSDVFSNIEDKYDLIITNPPYVPTAEYQSSPKEFKNEPKIALESGKTGLDIPEKILLQAREYLNPQGTLIAEVGYSTAKKLKKKYPKGLLEWFGYRKPCGTQPLLSMDGVFRIDANHLLKLETAKKGFSGLKWLEFFKRRQNTYQEDNEGILPR